MSSPTNVIINIQTPGISKETCAKVADVRQREWRAEKSRIEGHNDRAPYYAMTDQLIDEFYSRVVSYQAYSWGCEGDQLIFAFDGDYINEEEILVEIGKFLKALNAADGLPPYFNCATVFAAHEDSPCYVWKISDEDNYTPSDYGVMKFGLEKNT